jgi:hypothetical protein
MAEQIDLAAPEVLSVTNSTYQVDRLELDWGAARVHVTVKGSNGERRAFEYNGATATTMMVSLNTANLSTQSLQRRILARLITDGKLAGTISGTPD